MKVGYRDEASQEDKQDAQKYRAAISHPTTTE
jgi:hypothetical protein